MVTPSTPPTRRRAAPRRSPPPTTGGASAPARGRSSSSPATRRPIRSLPRRCPTRATVPPNRSCSAAPPPTRSSTRSADSHASTPRPHRSSSPAPPGKAPPASAPPPRSPPSDLRSGGCTLARQAIVVGGPAAVPPAVDDELVSLGYDEVFRVSGANRYGTAAAIATALGVGQFVDPADAMRRSGGQRRRRPHGLLRQCRRRVPRQCHRLPCARSHHRARRGRYRGRRARRWLVDQLLAGSRPAPRRHRPAPRRHDRGAHHAGRRPRDHPRRRRPHPRVGRSTRSADLTGAETIRIAGSDRYATSVEMAQRLGGWLPNGRADEYSGARWSASPRRPATARRAKGGRTPSVPAPGVGRPAEPLSAPPPGPSPHPAHR